MSRNLPGWWGCEGEKGGRGEVAERPSSKHSPNLLNVQVFKCIFQVLEIISCTHTKMVYPESLVLDYWIPSCSLKAACQFSNVAIVGKILTHAFDITKSHSLWAAVRAATDFLIRRNTSLRKIKLLNKLVYKYRPVLLLSLGRNSPPLRVKLFSGVAFSIVCGQDVWLNVN